MNPARRKSADARHRPAKADSGATARRPGARKWGRLHWLRIGALAIAAVVVLWALHRHFDASALQHYVGRINGAAAFALLVVLPLLGCPASVLHVAIGARFGLPLGMLLVAASIGLQLLASYALVHCFRAQFARRFERIRNRIPRGAHASIAVFAVLLPGAPFFAVNYALPLLGVRLRTYLLCCWPLHTLRATVTVALGGQLTRLTPGRVIGLAVYAALLAGASAWLYRRLRRQLADPPAAEDGRTQSA